MKKKKTTRPNIYIFCDIDGVLNTSRYRKSQQQRTGTNSRYDWCPVACNNLAFVCRFARAKIVVSSSWRHTHDLPQLKKVFGDNGVQQNYVVGATPAVDELVHVWDEPYFDKYCRGHEIEEWLLCNDPDAHYIIIDDQGTPSETALHHQQDYYIQVDSENGFADQRAFNKAINILSDERK